MITESLIYVAYCVNRVTCIFQMMSTIRIRARRTSYLSALVYKCLRLQGK